MDKLSSTYQVTIVGGGPVGLFLAAGLSHFGISSIILEKRAVPRSGSRSIGIHPVSIELFQKLDIADRFIKKGVKILRGLAFANIRKIGSLSFDNCPKPFNFILSLPQIETERILESYVRGLQNVAIIREAEAVNFEQEAQYIHSFFEHDGHLKNIKSSFLIGCDGKDSIIRRKANIAFEGRAYSDRYIMGDFFDNTSFGTDAAIFLCREGLIESFPLPNKKRRWVVKVPHTFPSPDREIIEQQVNRRINFSLFDVENMMLSGFGVQKYLAKPMVKNRLILAGDAAHVVSPIGGQGMNLGWLSAWDLARSLDKVLNHKASRRKIMIQFEKRRIKAAKNSMRRAEINMRLGRKTAVPFVRNSIVSVMLNTPLSQLMANIFAMRGVEKWVI